MRARVLALVVLLLLAGCTARRGDNSPDPAPDGSGPPVGKSSASMTVDGQDRTYRVYRPAGLPASAPLVLVLHGAAGTGQQAEDSYGWDAEADSGKFLAVFPDGVRRSWNVSKDCCGISAKDGVDDVKFLSELAGSFGDLVDKKKVFATGISNGAFMTYKLACDTKILAGIAPVSGTLLSDCASPQPLSILAIHGTADKTVPYNGGPGKRANAGADARIPALVDGPAIPDLMATWRKTDSCTTPKTTKSGSVTTSVASCPSDRSVELITIDGAGHQWPGGKEAPMAQKLLGLDAPSTAIKATPTIWKFFSSRSLS